MKFNLRDTATFNLTTTSDEEVDRLKAAVWRHKVVVVKNQPDLQPKKQWELVTRLDPKASDGHSHGSITTFRAKGGLLAVKHPRLGTVSMILPLTTN